MSQKQGKIQTAWQYVIPEVKMTPNRVNKTRLPEAEREGPKCQPGRGENMQRIKNSR